MEKMEVMRKTIQNPGLGRLYMERIIIMERTSYYNLAIEVNTLAVLTSSNDTNTCEPRSTISVVDPIYIYNNIIHISTYFGIMKAYTRLSLLLAKSALLHLAKGKENTIFAETRQISLHR